MYLSAALVWPMTPVSHGIAIIVPPAHVSPMCGPGHQWRQGSAGQEAGRVTRWRPVSVRLSPTISQANPIPSLPQLTSYPSEDTFKLESPNTFIEFETGGFYVDPHLVSERLDCNCEPGSLIFGLNMTQIAHE